jgi:hypothetical protein
MFLPPETAQAEEQRRATEQFLNSIALDIYVSVIKESDGRALLERHARFSREAAEVFAETLGLVSNGNGG